MKKKAIRKPMTLEVGKRYRGSGVINEFGEVNFTAYQQQTTEKNALRKVTSESSEECTWALYHSDDVVSIRLSVSKQDLAAMQRIFRDAFVKSLISLESYEI